MTSRRRVLAGLIAAPLTAGCRARVGPTAPIEPLPKTLRVMTLSCVNEDPASPTDGLRRIYNREIRLAAGELNIPVVDIGEAVDAVLSGKGRWYETSSMGEMVLDGIRSRIPGGTDSISGKRKLVLTIDGVHLNRRGARLYAEVISRAVEELSQH